MSRSRRKARRANRDRPDADPKPAAERRDRPVKDAASDLPPWAKYPRAERPASLARIDRVLTWGSIVVVVILLITFGLMMLNP